MLVRGAMFAFLTKLLLVADLERRTAELIASTRWRFSISWLQQARELCFLSIPSGGFQHFFLQVGSIEEELKCRKLLGRES